MDSILKVLKELFTKAMLKRLGIALGGFKGWIASFLIKYGYSHIVEPFIKWSIQKGYLGTQKVKGWLKYKRLRDAETPDDFFDELNRDKLRRVPPHQEKLTDL